MLEKKPSSKKIRFVAKHTQERLVGSATTGNDADHSSGTGADDLLGTRGELDSGLALIGVVADDGDVVAGGSAQSATVTDLLLDVGDDGTLRHLTEGKDVADGQGSLLASVDELTSVHSLVGDEGLGDLLELVGVSEDDLGEGSTATCSNPTISSSFPLTFFPFSVHRRNPSGSLASIVDDIADYTSEVAMALGVVEVAELGRSLVQARVGSYPVVSVFIRGIRSRNCSALTENGSTTLALVANDSTHGDSSSMGVDKTGKCWTNCSQSKSSGGEKEDGILPGLGRLVFCQSRLAS